MTAKMMSPTPMGRMYKTILGISAMPPPKFLLTYLMATRPLLKTMPGFFEEARKNQIDLLIQQLQQNLNLMEVRSKETSTKSGPGKDKIMRVRIPILILIFRIRYNRPYCS